MFYIVKYYYISGDVMGTGPDALATGLTCVDNLTLIEHIGK